MKLEKVINDDLNKLLEIRTDDDFTIESVYYRGDTLCVSSQVGCPVECAFCASGLNGLKRNLSYEEIINQYNIAVQNGYTISNITFAGIGEPLLNWENVKKAFWFFKKNGLKVSFYTTGFPLKNFKELLTLPHNGISVSIHAVDEEKRKFLIPKSARLENILDILKEHVKNLSNRKRKLYSLAYLLIKDVNDTYNELEKLSKLAKDLGLSVSLLKYNQIENIPFETTSDEDYEKAFLFLRKKGIKVTLSNRYRTRKIGGCGTLMINRLKKEEGGCPSCM